MRIAYICADPGVPVFGRKGSSVHVQEVIRALLRKGATVTLFADRFDAGVPADLAQVQVRKLPRAPKGDPSERERRSLAANADLRQLLHEDGPFDLVYERYSLWSHAAIDYAAEQGIPSVLEVNAPLIEEQASHRDLVNRAAAESVCRQVFSGASVIAAVSTEVARYVESFPGTAGKVVITPNGVNPDRFPQTIVPALEREPGTFVLGFVGTLKRWHGLPVLVEAFARLHRQDAGMRLLIVGDGTERASIEEDVRSRGLGDVVTFAGAVAPGDVPAYLAAMDAGLAPYPNVEDFYFSPLKVFEYMAAGLPVVASDIGQMPEFIAHRRTGLLCTPGDAGAIVTAVRELRSDAALCNVLGANARAFVLENQTWDGIVQRIVERAGLGKVAVAGVGA